MTDFILKRLGVKTERTMRHANTAIACTLAVFDIYTDINTVYTLYTSNEKQLCSYDCPALLASTLIGFILYSMITQARYVYSRYDGNILYTVLAFIGYAPIVIAMDIWDDIENNDKYKRYIFQYTQIFFHIESNPEQEILHQQSVGKKHIPMEFSFLCFVIWTQCFIVC